MCQIGTQILWVEHFRDLFNTATPYYWNKVSLRYEFAIFITGFRIGEIVAGGNQVRRFANEWWRG